MEPHQIALNKAKIQLMSRPDSVFFTTVCFSLKHSFNDSIRTACTDGRSIEFSPRFFMELTPPEQLFLLLHETMHVCYMHMEESRRGDRDPKKWNIAADHVINLQLIERGFTMPSGKNQGHADRAYIGMSTEEVYKALPDDPNAECDMDLQFSPDITKELEQEIADILVRAAVQSKMAGDKAGTIPGDIQVFLDRLLNPKLPWQTILRKYMQSFAKNDYSFRKPSRRYFPKHHLPSMYSESLMNLAAFCDISGSVTDHEFKTTVSELSGIMKMMKPDKITFGQFDTGIKTVTEVRSIEEMSKITFTGRGGTLIEPVIEWANEHKPQLLLIFSDGEFYFPEGLDTKTKVIWLVYNNPGFTAPFGKVIHFEIKE